MQDSGSVLHHNALAQRKCASCQDAGFTGDIRVCMCSSLWILGYLVFTFFSLVVIVYTIKVSGRCGERRDKDPSHARRAFLDLPLKSIRLGGARRNLLHPSLPRETGGSSSVAKHEPREVSPRLARPASHGQS